MRISVIIIFLSVIFSSCIDRPEFPVTPKIEFRNIYFVDNITDSLVLTIQFEDGDGDLGLTSSQNTFPYHEYNFYSRKTGEELNAKAARLDQPISVSEAIHFSDKRTGAIDTLPAFTSPYSCTRWIGEPALGLYSEREADTLFVIPPRSDHPLLLRTRGGIIYSDTLYYQSNPNHYNIFIQFLLRDPQGNFEVFDWDQRACRSTYNGRFPMMLDSDKEKAIEGTLTYKLQGAALGAILDRKIVKLRIHILDRALHKSNVVETPEFILSEITK